MNIKFIEINGYRLEAFCQKSEIQMLKIMSFNYIYLMYNCYSGETFDRFWGLCNFEGGKRLPNYLPQFSFLRIQVVILNGLQHLFFTNHSFTSIQILLSHVWGKCNFVIF